MLMESPILKVDNLFVSYGRFEALKDVSLSVLSGETFGLIGLNGAGKTTLIKTILGLRDAKSGNIQIAGKSGYSKETRQRFAYLPERFNPPSFLSGMEFLHFSLSLYGRKLPDSDFIEGAEKLALAPEALKRSVHTYSKGMRQKLGLLATLYTGCDLLILDEPMSGLDPRARSYVKDMIKGIKEGGRTVFLSSHILSDMAEICDHVAILHKGQKVYDGTPSDMLKKTESSDMEHAFLDIIDTSEAVKAA
jgi:ABC-2 type transport system ATP-binding protein